MSDSKQRGVLWLPCSAGMQKQGSCQNLPAFDCCAQPWPMLLLPKTAVMLRYEYLARCFTQLCTCNTAHLILLSNMLANQSACKACGSPDHQVVCPSRHLLVFRLQIG